MKKIKNIMAILVVIMAAVVIDKVNIIDEVSTTNQTEELVFIHNQVVDVNIDIDYDIYLGMIENALDEEYVLADVTYNGDTFYNVAIRAKGNSSLKQVAESGDDRFSFKIDFDKYVDGQNLFGLTKLNLNNIFQDPSLMAEYIGYEMLDSIDAVASDTTYVALSINGEYFGLYLAVEEVDEAFLMEHYGNYDGELYKPDMGTGSDLIYISDDPTDYSGVTPQDDDMATNEYFVELVSVIDKIVENGGETEAYNLSNVMNVDSFLKYLALSTTAIHMDTYQSGMFHNYYLYFNTDTEKFEWIAWDLNMIFNGFPMSGLTDEEATQFLIDEPVIGEMSQYPLIEAIFTNDDYVDKYHDYIQELTDEYLSEEVFERKLAQLYTMIEPYASIDPSAFYDIQTVKESIFDTSDDTVMSLLEFAELRVDNIHGQLNGSLSSTNDGKGNQGSDQRGGRMGAIPEGGIPIGEMGQRPTDMKGEMGQRPTDMKGEMGQRPTDMKDEMDQRPIDMKNNIGNVGIMPGEDDSSTLAVEENVQEVVTIGLSLIFTSALCIYLFVRKY